jgi:outer membrane protein
VLVMGATSLFAQKFGRINTQEIIMAMPETKTMQENMDTFAKELSDNIETMNVEFNTKLQDFQKNYNTFSDAIKEVKEKELNDMQTRTREFQERAQQDYQKKQNELLAPIIDKAKAAIDKVATAGSYLAVFDTSTGSLAYFDEAMLTDLAPAVKKELGITDAPAATPAAPAAPAAK